MLRTFRSVRFNIFLGALIALASAAGTFLPQSPETPDKVDAFMSAHPQWSRLLDFLGFFNLYQSWWFMGLLGLMAFDIVVCKLWNKPPDAGMVALPPEVNREEEMERHLDRKEAALRLKPYQASFVTSMGADEVCRRAGEHLRRAGFHIQEEFALPAGSAFSATKHRIQRWGSYFAHIGLVVILVGALVKGVYGFVEMVPVLEGRSRAMRNKPDWEVFVDKFTIRYYEGTSNPKSFSSVMRVEKGDEVLGAKTIFVNDPLDIGGVRFYQASWGAGGMFRSATLAIGRAEVVLAQKTPTAVPGSPFKVEADLMLPNFNIAPDGRPGNASMDLKNPAVRFNFKLGPHKTAPIWLLRDNPNLCFVEDDDGILGRAPTPPFRLSAVDPVLFSGIQVAYDPGFKVVMAGSLMWLVGTTSLFYMHRRRLWVLVEPRGEGAAAVSVGGWSSRGPREFEREFAAAMGSLGESLSARDFKLGRNPLVEV